MSVVELVLGASPSDPAIAVSATAACNGLAVTSHQTWAFWRAELSGFVETPFVCPNGEQATMSLVRTLDPALQGTARLLAILRTALREVGPVLQPLPPSLRVGCSLAVPRRLGTEKGGAPAPSFLGAVQAALDATRPGIELHVLPGDHAAGGLAFAEVCRALQRGTLDVGLVAGVDSSYDPEVVEALAAGRRLFDGENLEAAIHGEGAAVLVVVRADRCRALGWTETARIQMVATQEDPSPGPHGALSAVTRWMKGRGAMVDWLIADVNGEPERVEEWMLALPRAFVPGGLDTAGKDFREVAADRIRLDQLPECFGDLGAATLPTAAVVAVEGLQRGQPEAASCIVTSSIPRGPRAAVLLGTGSRK